VLKQQSSKMKVNMRSQSLAISKLEKDLEQLLRYFSHQAGQDPAERVVSRDELTQLLRVVECFRELEPLESAKEKALVGPLIGGRSQSRSVSPHVKKDNYRQGLRLKQEQEFLSTLWTRIISPHNPVEVQFEMVNETFKVLFNNYIPAQKQAELLYDLQMLASELGNTPQKAMSKEEIEEKIIKRLQTLYPHYFDLTNISKIANQEKILNSIKDHYKEFTFKPKINPESTNLDFHNISQVYAKL